MVRVQRAVPVLRRSALAFHLPGPATVLGPMLRLRRSTMVREWPRRLVVMRNLQTLSIITRMFPLPRLLMRVVLMLSLLVMAPYQPGRGIMYSLLGLQRSHLGSLDCHPGFILLSRPLQLVMVGKKLAAARARSLLRVALLL